MKIIQINNNLEEHIKNEIIIYFYADWCKYCNMLTPIINEYEKTNKSDLIIGKINIDDNPLLSLKYNIEYVPTFIKFKNNEIISSCVVTSKQQLDELLNI
ncbi:MAG: thioredoxin family protein [Bacilli bacterium]|nr:thioredoxin family protein [Bacilli bacterium]